MNIIRLSSDEALPKIKQYCSYQERCHIEVKDKLYSFGLYKCDVEKIICLLIEENYLNEERFAIQFAGGKFRLKQWGKIKIMHALKKRSVNDYCIKKALAQINTSDYQKTIQKVALIKFQALKNEKNIFTKKRKLQDFLLQKGFGYEDVDVI